MFSKKKFLWDLKKYGKLVVDRMYAYKYKQKCAIEAVINQKQKRDSSHVGTILRLKKMILKVKPISLKNTFHYLI